MVTCYVAPLVIEFLLPTPSAPRNATFCVVLTGSARTAYSLDGPSRQPDELVGTSRQLHTLSLDD